MFSAEKFGSYCFLMFYYLNLYCAKLEVYFIAMCKRSLQFIVCIFCHHHVVILGYRKNERRDEESGRCGV